MGERNTFQMQLADEIRLVVKRYRRDLNVSAVEAWEAVSDVADDLAESGPDVRATTSNDSND